jgi:hypothetical protein
MVYAIKIMNLICCNSELYRDNLTTIDENKLQIIIIYVVSSTVLKHIVNTMHLGYMKILLFHIKNTELPIILSIIRTIKKVITIQLH